MGLPSVEICAAGAVVDEPVADVVPQEVVYDSSQSVLDDLPSAKTDAPGTGTNKPSAKTDAPHIVVPHPHVDGGGLGLAFLDTDAPDIEGDSGSGELPCIELVAPGAGAEVSSDFEVEGYGFLGEDVDIDSPPQSPIRDLKSAKDANISRAVLYQLKINWGGG